MNIFAFGWDESLTTLTTYERITAQLQTLFDCICNSTLHFYFINEINEQFKGPKPCDSCCTLRVDLILCSVPGTPRLAVWLRIINVSRFLRRERFKFVKNRSKSRWISKILSLCLYLVSFICIRWTTVVAGIASDFVTKNKSQSAK